MVTPLPCTALKKQKKTTQNDGSPPTSPEKKSLFSQCIPNCDLLSLLLRSDQVRFCLRGRVGITVHACEIKVHFSVCAGAFFTASRFPFFWFCFVSSCEWVVGRLCRVQRYFQSVVSKRHVGHLTWSSHSQPVALGVESAFPPLVRTRTEGTMFLEASFSSEPFVPDISLQPSHGATFIFYLWIFVCLLICLFVFAQWTFPLGRQMFFTWLCKCLYILNERMCLLWKYVCVRVVLCMRWYISPLRSEPNLILPRVVKNIEYLLNLLLLLERLSYYCYNALPGISVYICYYNRKRTPPAPQGSPWILRTESFMSSPVSSCDTFGGPWGHIVKCDEWQTNKTAKDFPGHPFLPWITTES